MNLQNIKTLIKENLIYYLTGFLIVFGLKLFYSKADCDMLTWILAPTARWVSILSGIPFWYEPGMGYVNYGLKFIIASSCSGVSFMIITIATLIFSFVHRFDRPQKKAGWILGSIIFSYLYTVFVNGLRIILAIYIPLNLEEKGFISRYLTAARLHTLIGTVVYFTALLTIYNVTGYLFQGTAVRKCFSPVFWYFLMVLGVPLLNRANRSNSMKFADYTVLITITCAIILLIFMVLPRRRFHKKNQ
ncbi:MAG: exosortase K [Lachnospiraceae bacterium]|nr:exosortase K [Lachnospiraceae bacterium]